MIQGISRLQKILLQHGIKLLCAQASGEHNAPITRGSKSLSMKVIEKGNRGMEGQDLHNEKRQPGLRLRSKHRRSPAA